MMHPIGSIVKLVDGPNTSQDMTNGNFYRVMEHDGSCLVTTCDIEGDTRRLHHERFESGDGWIITTADRTINYWPICTECKLAFEFEPEEPFAYCGCGTTEWGYPRPAPGVVRPSAPVVI
jgi:hypothetical protein